MVDNLTGEQQHQNQHDDQRYEEESVTDLYTTDGNSPGAEAKEAAFRARVREEQERIFLEYQLEIPSGETATSTAAKRATGTERGGARAEAEVAVDSMLDKTGDMLNKDKTTTGSNSNSNINNNYNGNFVNDAGSVITENPILRANMEAEEGRSMAEFDFDYSIQSSCDLLDGWVAPPTSGTTMAHTGADSTDGSTTATRTSSQTLAVRAVTLGGGGGDSIPSQRQAQPSRRYPPTLKFPPLAPSVETGERSTIVDLDVDVEDASSLDTNTLCPHDVEQGGRGGGESNHSNDNTNSGGAMNNASSSTSALAAASCLVKSTLKILMPTANGNSNHDHDNNSMVKNTNSGGGSDCSPTEKTLSPTGTDLSKNEDDNIMVTPDRNSRTPRTGSPRTSSTSGAVPPSPPSVIVLGSVPCHDEESMNRHDNNCGRKGYYDNSGSCCLTRFVRKLCRTWLGRIILLLLIAIIVSIGVALGGLIVYRQQAAAASASSSANVGSNTGSDGGSGTTPTSPTNGNQNTSTTNSTQVLTPPANINRTDVKPPDEEPEEEKEEDDKDETEKVVTTTPTSEPTAAVATISPTFAPLSPAPSAGPSATPAILSATAVPTEKEGDDEDCQDSTTAIFYVNREYGDQDCAFLSDKPGYSELLCQPEYEPYRLCPVTCGTCSLIATATSAPATTTTDTAVTSSSPSSAQSSAPISAPSSAPSIPYIDTPSVRDIVMYAIATLPSQSEEDWLARLDEEGSAPYQALMWLENEQQETAGTTSDASPPFLVQRFAAATLGFSTGAAGSWTTNTNWLSTDSQCEWHGITCTEDDAAGDGDDVWGTTSGITVIESIDLPLNNLNGPIPPEVALLASSLVRLDLANNTYMMGTLPSELGLLSRLETLFLDHNDFSGTLPSEIGQMTSLERLHIESNRFEGTVPESIVELTNLEELYLWRTDLTGAIPAEICEIESLDKLYVDCTKVEVSCFTRCYYQCGGTTGVDCNAEDAAELLKGDYNNDNTDDDNDYYKY